MLFSAMRPFVGARTASTAILQEMMLLTLKLRIRLLERSRELLLLRLLLLQRRKLLLPRRWPRRFLMTARFHLIECVCVARGI